MRKSGIIKLTIVIILVLAVVITCINPIFPNEMFLQHLGTLFLLIILFTDIRKNYLWLSSFIGIATFTLIHVIGARYIYSFVPYNDWVKNLSGIGIDIYFGFTRNHYDRFVHLVFGILFFPFLMQIFSKWTRLNATKVALIVWLTIQTLSMCYELFEWLLTLLLSAEAADNYNGQQGDMWDSQKDMALAMLGSTVMSLMIIIKSFIRRKKT